jgi:DNA-binding CsgD family transcriptional regulator
VSLGCSVDEVARILQVAAPTVDNTKAHVMTKLGVTKAATLTRAVIKAKISSLSDELTAAEKRRMRRGLK